jgi:hypothetical protein
MLLNDMTMVEASMKMILSCWPYHEAVMYEVSQLRGHALSRLNER